MFRILLLVSILIYNGGISSAYCQGQQIMIHSDSLDFGTLIDRNIDRELFIGGGTWSGDSTSWNSFIVKCDENGQLLWQQTFGISGEYEFVSSLLATSDNGVMCLLTLYSSFPYSALIVKFDSTGSLEWTSRLDSVYQTFDLIKTYDNAFAFSFVGIFGYGVAKVDSAGNLLSTYTISSNTFYPIEELVLLQTSDSGYVISGTGSNSDIFLVKFSFTGQVVWTRRLIDSGLEYVWEILPYDDSTFLMLGSNMDAPNSYSVLIKFGYEGDTIWSKSYRTTALGEDFRATGLSIDSVGCIYFSATKLILGWYSYVELVKLDSSGMPLNSILIGDGNDIEPSDMILDDRRIDIVGINVNYVVDSMGRSHCVLLQIDSAGNPGCYLNPLSVQVGAEVFTIDTVEHYHRHQMLVHNSLTYPLSFNADMSADVICNPNAISEPSVSIPSFKLHPNPCQSVTYLSIEDGTAQDYWGTIYNISGQLVQSFRGYSNEVKLDLSGQNPGIYFYSFSFSSGKRVAGKIVLTN
jgi:Secretion system C-terminal sorting domain